MASEAQIRSARSLAESGCRSGTLRAAPDVDSTTLEGSGGRSGVTGTLV